MCQEWRNPCPDDRLCSRTSRHCRVPLSLSLLLVPLALATFLFLGILEHASPQLATVEQMQR
jgi:hypothetical protein